MCVWRGQQKDCFIDIMQSVSSAGAVPTSFYYGTIGTLPSGALIGRVPTAVSHAEQALDLGRTPAVGLRSMAVSAASSVLDATAIAAIRCYSPSKPLAHEAIHVYRVRLAHFHLGPVAILEEVEDRLQSRSQPTLDSLISEYWTPTSGWHLNEILAASMSILEEVPATSERDTYIRRWVQYNQDRLRAKAL